MCNLLFFIPRPSQNPFKPHFQILKEQNEESQDAKLSLHLGAFELSFGILLFPYIIHMGLSSILQIFDSTEMEYSLCFLMKK